MAEDVANKKVIIDVEANSDKVASSIIELQKELGALKNKRNELTAANAKDTVEFQRNEAAIRATSAEIRKQQGVLTKNTQEINAESGSLVQLRAQLASATAAYDALSKTEREGAAGQAFKDHIKEINDELKKNEEETGRFTRNVGNYASFMGKSLSQSVPQITQLSMALAPLKSQIDEIRSSYRAVASDLRLAMKNTQGLSGAQKIAATTSAVLSAAMKVLKVALISTGIGAIVVALGALITYMSRSQKGSEQLSKGLAQIGAVVDVLLDRLAKLGGAVYSLFTGDFSGALENAKAAFAGVGDEIQRETKLAAELKQAEIDLNKQEILLSAKRSAQGRQMAELRKISEDTTKSLGERLAAARKAGEMERSLAAEELAIGEKKLANMLGFTEVTEEARDMMKQLGENTIEADEAISRLGLSESKVGDLKAAVDEYNKVQDAQKASQDQQKELQAKAQQLIKENGEKIIAREREIGESRIKAEAGYQSDDFAMKLSYARRIYDLNEGIERKNLDLQLRYGTIQEADYKARLEVMANARKEFEIGQAKEANAYYKSQREAILSMFDKSAEEQIAEVNEKFNKAYKQLEAMNRAAPDPQAYEGGEDNEEYQKELKRYEEFLFNKSTIEVRMEEQKNKEIEEINKNSLRKRAEDIEKAVSEEYGDDLRQYQSNERKKTEITIKQLEEQKKRKEEAGLDTYDEEAGILDARRKLNQMDLDADLLAAGENAKARYEAKKAFYAKERKLAEGNADQLAQIRAKEEEADKEYRLAQIERLQEWADVSMELMSGVNDLFNALDEARLQKVQENYDAESAALKQKLDDGLLSQEEYDKEQQKLDKELEREQKKIARQQAIREKAMSMFKIAVDTSLAIMGAVAASPLSGGLPWSAIVAAMGAVQLATVAAQPIPKAARGRLIKGKSHAQGGELVVAEDGELIMNKRSVSMFGPLLSDISVAGGGVPFTSNVSDGGFTSRWAASRGMGYEEMRRAMTDAVKQVRVVATIEDIRRENDIYVTATSRGTL